MHSIAMLQKYLPIDYEKIKSALEKKDWEKLKDVNHALLGALMYCDALYLKNASIRLKNASGIEIEMAALELLREMERIINYVV